MLLFIFFKLKLNHSKKQFSNFILFKKNEKTKKKFSSKKKRTIIKIIKYNKIKNIKDIQIKEESESDSVSIDEEENIIKSPLKNKDIKIKLYQPNISKNKNSITLLKIIIIFIKKITLEHNQKK